MLPSVFACAMPHRSDVPETPAHLVPLVTQPTVRIAAPGDLIQEELAASTLQDVPYVDDVPPEEGIVRCSSVDVGSCSQSGVARAGPEVECFLGMGVPTVPLRGETKCPAPAPQTHSANGWGRS